MGTSDSAIHECFISGIFNCYFMRRGNIPFTLQHACSIRFETVVMKMPLREPREYAK